MLKITEYPQVNKVVTGLFCLYVIIWHLEVAKRFPALANLRLEFLLGSILILLGCLAILNKPASHSEDEPFMAQGLPGAIFLFLLVLGFNLFLSRDFNLSWELFFNRVVKFACMTFFLSTFVFSPTHLRLFFASAFLAYLKVGQEAFYGKISGSMVWENQGIMRLHGTQGSMFGHPNSLSGKTLGILPFMYYLFPFLQKYWKALILVFLVFAGNILVFTGSRTGYIVFLVMLALIFWHSKNKGKIILIFSVLIMVGFQFIPEQYKERFTSSFSGQEAEGASKRTRIGLIEDSWMVFLENPAGVGMGCFKLVQAEAGRNDQDTHNLYLELLAETGIQGFVCFFLMIQKIMTSLRGLERKFGEKRKKLAHLMERKKISEEVQKIMTQNIHDLGFLAAVCAGTSLFVYLRLFLGLFGHDLLELYWWIAAGLALALSNIYQTTTKRVNELVRAAEEFESLPENEFVEL